MIGQNYDESIEYDLPRMVGMGRASGVSLEEEWKRELHERRGAKSNLNHHATRRRFIYSQGRQLKSELHQFLFEDSLEYLMEYEGAALAED